jgi:predicted tellurium resistance membrane protein TerC
MEILLEPSAWIALLTLTFLEIVLGIDNIIFISIVSNKLPVEKQQKARTWGLALALIMRVGMLLAITWIIRFKEPIFTLFDEGFSIRDIILMIGGLFLLYKTTLEIHQKMEGEAHKQSESKAVSMKSVIFQIIMLDIIFSFDSILTAIGLTEELTLMIIAVTISILVMMKYAKTISEFIGKHPSLEILALSFLILIGFMLMIEALHYHVPKGYIYFAVFFSLMVELINMRIKKTKKPVKLHKRIQE